MAEKSRFSSVLPAAKVGQMKMKQTFQAPLRRTEPIRKVGKRRDPP